MAATDLEVVGIVAGSDLQCAGAELRLDVVVGDDRQAASDQRQDHRLADQVTVTLIVRMHGHCHIREHGLRAHGGHHHLPVLVGHRVSD